jgi:hypothetical protein
MGHLSRHWRAGVDHIDTGADDLLDQRTEVDVVGAAQHQSIDLFGDQRVEACVQHSFDCRPVGDPLFGELDQPMAYLANDSDVSGKAGDKLVKDASAEGGICGDYSDALASTSFRSGFYGRDDADEWYVEGLPQVG